MLASYIKLCAEYHLVYVDLRDRRDVRDKLGDDETWVKLMIMSTALEHYPPDAEVWQVFEGLSISDVKQKSIGTLFSVLGLVCTCE